MILFIGDGMGIPAVTSARISRNQRAGKDHIGFPLFFESFEATGMVKTSSASHLVTDSAAGATALLTGRKVNTRSLGMKPTSKEICTSEAEMHIVDGLVEGALQLNMSIGFVTSTRVTHATPAALYAKGVDRDAEYDEADVRCVNDIAKQLLSYPASEFKVMMGGGSKYLMDKSRNGSRGDGLNVDLEWKELGGNRTILRTVDDLTQLNVAEDEKLLGIFADSHFPYYMDEVLENRQTVPRLHEMTRKAVEHLQKNDEGFFLMVEGGLIDMAEHENWMHVTFSEVYEFEEAIRVARETTSSDDTLIIVTADHGHALTLPGYLPAVETIFESSSTHDNKHKDGGAEFFVPAMFFATGPGYREGFGTHDSAAVEQPFYRQPSAIPTKYGYHGGEDVGIWADGPFSHLFSSSMENTEVAYTMKFLLCAGTEGHSICDIGRREEDIADGAPTDSFEKRVLERFGLKTVTVAAIVLLVIAVASLLSTVFLASLLHVQKHSFAQHYKANAHQRIF